MSVSVPASRKRQRVAAPQSPDVYMKLYRSAVMDRIALVNKGVAEGAACERILGFARLVGTRTNAPQLPLLSQKTTLAALGLPAATFNKKVKARGTLSAAESERVLGFARLVGQVEAMIGEGTNALNFDTRAWLSRWLTEPLPALDQGRPIDLMNTIEGQNLVPKSWRRLAAAHTRDRERLAYCGRHGGLQGG